MFLTAPSSYSEFPTVAPMKSESTALAIDTYNMWLRFSGGKEKPRRALAEGMIHDAQEHPFLPRLASPRKAVGDPR